MLPLSHLQALILRIKNGNVDPAGTAEQLRQLCLATDEPLAIEALVWLAINFDYPCVENVGGVNLWHVYHLAPKNPAMFGTRILTIYCRCSYGEDRSPAHSEPIYVALPETVATLGVDSLCKKYGLTNTDDQLTESGMFCNQMLFHIAQHMHDNNSRYTVKEMTQWLAEAYAAVVEEWNNDDD